MHNIFQTTLAETEQLVKQSHDPAVIAKINEKIKNDYPEYAFYEFELGQPLTVDAVKIFGPRINRPVINTAYNDITSYGVGILVGCLVKMSGKNKLFQNLGVIYCISEGEHIVVAFEKDIELKSATSETFFGEVLLDMGAEIVSSVDVPFQHSSLSTTREGKAHAYSYKLPNTPPGYTFFYNDIELESGHRSTKFLKDYFFIGVQIKSPEYTKSLLEHIAEDADKTEMLGWRGVIEGMEPQLSVTPLISKGSFLKKFSISDMFDMKKIMRFYAYEMIRSSQATVPVNTLTAQTDVFLNSGPGKAERLDFDFLRNQLINFICLHGIQYVNVLGADFIFYDNPVYDAIYENLYKRAVALNKSDPIIHASAIKPRLVIGGAIIPPFFVDLDDRAIFSADSYTNHTKLMGDFGKIQAPGTPHQHRIQSGWASISAAISQATLYEQLSPRDIVTILNLALI